MNDASPEGRFTYTNVNITADASSTAAQSKSVRQSALGEARRLLLEGGPDAVTLKAVSQALGMSHPNLIHHFGSAAGLQSALMSAMLEDLTAALSSRVEQVRSGEMSPRAFVDLVFDGFESGGAGRLAAWIALSHDESRFDPVRSTLAAMAGALRRPQGSDAASATQFLAVALLALGDSLIGRTVRGELGLPDDAARELAATLLVQLQPRPESGPVVEAL